MNNKIIIIIPNETKTNARFYASKGTVKYHKKEIEKYIYQNEISLSSYNFYELNNIYYELTEQGFCIITIDENKDIKNAIIYLPETISEKQLEYFKKEKELLSKYQTGILSIEENHFKPIKPTTPEETIIDTLHNELTNRLSPPSKKLTKKKDNKT